jgi:hypothetical protein
MGKNTLPELLTTIFRVAKYAIQTKWSKIQGKENEYGYKPTEIVVLCSTYHHHSHWLIILTHLPIVHFDCLTLKMKTLLPFKTPKIITWNVIKTRSSVHIM